MGKGFRFGTWALIAAILLATLFPALAIEEGESELVQGESAEIFADKDTQYIATAAADDLIDDSVTVLTLPDSTFTVFQEKNSGMSHIVSIKYFQSPSGGMGEYAYCLDATYLDPHHIGYEQSADEVFKFLIDQNIEGEPDRLIDWLSAILTIGENYTFDTTAPEYTNYIYTEVALQYLIGYYQTMYGGTEWQTSTNTYRIINRVYYDHEDAIEMVYLAPTTPMEFCETIIEIVEVAEQYLDFKALYGDDLETLTVSLATYDENDQVTGIYRDGDELPIYSIDANHYFKTDLFRFVITTEDENGQLVIVDEGMDLLGYFGSELRAEIYRWQTETIQTNIYFDFYMLDETESSGYRTMVKDGWGIYHIDDLNALYYVELGTATPVSGLVVYELEIGYWMTTTECVGGFYWSDNIAGGISRHQSLIGALRRETKLDFEGELKGYGHWGIELVKYGPQGSTQQLAGAVFHLYGDDGSGGKVRLDDVDYVTGYTYSADGQVTANPAGYEGYLYIDGFSLTQGTVYLKEDKAPPGYIISDSAVEYIPFSYTTGAFNYYYSGTVYNDLGGAVRLIKSDKADDSKLLAGAEFELYDSTGKRIGTYTTDSDGVIEVDDLPYGDYYFIETKAPDGYILPQGTGARFDFTIDENSLEADGYLYLHVKNAPISMDFPFRKVNADDTSDPLQGAKFTLYACGHEHDTSCGGDTDPGLCNHTHDELQATGSCWSVVVDEQTSDANGLVAFTDLHSGDYQLVETQAPDGYQLPTGQWRIEIDAENETITITAKAGATVPPAFQEAGPSDLEADYLLGNIAEYELPQAGGGAFWITTLGLTLTLVGAAWAVRGRRRSGRWGVSKP